MAYGDGGGSAATKSTTYSLADRRREFQSYASVKWAEIEEARLVDRYFDGRQWTRKQLKRLAEREQPAITFDFTSPKVKTTVGVLRRLRTDPKAFPRNEGEQAGADLATQCVRYSLDNSRFERTDIDCLMDFWRRGIGVAELALEKGDHQDPDLGLNYTDPRTWFYDPRSVRPDFSDARFMGVSKWTTKDEVYEIWPEARGRLEGLSFGAGGAEFTTQYDFDRERLWQDPKGRLRLCDHWFMADGEWQWCLYIGNLELISGSSPFFNKKGRSISKFIAMSYDIDSDGDRYGAVRRMLGPQDAINQHRSKALYIMNVKRILAEQGTIDDIEQVRKESARPDGVVIVAPGALQNGSFRYEADDQAFLENTQYYQDAKAMFDSIGPNPALQGDVGASASGRAYAIAQQAGLAELGPHLQNYRDWKLSIFEAVWCAEMRYWTAERTIRVTDDQKLAQFLTINTFYDPSTGQPIIDPQTGNPVIFNKIGALDVDIVLDEGPDTETVVGDTNDLLEAMSQNGVPVPPETLIEASPLPQSKKDKLLASLQEHSQPQSPNPALMAQAQAETEKTRSEARKNDAAAAKDEVAAFGQISEALAQVGGYPVPAMTAAPPAAPPAAGAAPPVGAVPPGAGGVPPVPGGPQPQPGPGPGLPPLGPGDMGPGPAAVPPEEAAEPANPQILDALQVLAESVDNIQQMLARLMAPKTAHYHPDGRPAGYEQGGDFHPVNYDDQGRITSV